MRSKFIFLLLPVLVCFLPVKAQHFTVIEENENYRVYELFNPELKIVPPFEVNAPVVNFGVAYEVLNSETVDLSYSIDSTRAMRNILSPTTSPVVEVGYIGMFRGNETASLKLHVARFSEKITRVTKRLVIKIPKNSKTPVPKSSRLSKVTSGNHPLSTGEWYRLALPKEGIYELTQAYLNSLGISVSDIDPRNIQIWGTDGKMLPETNNEERSQFQQLPIIVQGESDGIFDSGDRVLFYGTSPHKITRTSNAFIHQIHPYSDTVYVFLTVGSNPGNRISTASIPGTATQTISSFDDFIWLEQELNKSEENQKTGRYWLGQRIPATAQDQSVTIFKDTIPGILPDAQIAVSGKIYARALTRTNHQLWLNGTNFSQFSINRISDGYSSYSGASANQSSFSGIRVNPTVENDILEMTYMMQNGDNGASAFVDYLRLVVPRTLTAENNRLLYTAPFHNEELQTVEYKLTGFSAKPVVLDISNPVQPLLLPSEFDGGTVSVSYNNSMDNRFLAQSQFYRPAASKKLANQNLTGLTNYPDYIVVTSPIFLSYAQELAAYRAQDGLIPLVVTQEQILNEFSGGAKDPSAIRDFMKFLWDRALADGEPAPKYLLLYGDTTYDTKNITENAFVNYVLTWESPESINRIGSYGSDDYFGFMDDGEGAFTAGSRIDIGVGRIPSQNRREARILLDKIYTYESPASAGDWQNLITFVGDDDFPDRIANRDLHVWNADGTADRMKISDNGLRLKKIYLFDYKEEITGAGRKFPEATADLLNTINNGTLVMNYSGHGNTTTLSDEELFHTDYIPSLTNKNKLTIFVTATCQFGRYDDISAQSGAEKLLFADNGGAVSAFTTTRVVYTSSSPNGQYNFALNIAFSQKLLEKDSEGRPSRLGDIYLQTKNTNSGASSNSRRFILLGDPAMRIALPDNPAQITSVNGFNVVDADTTLTIKALDRITLGGQIYTTNGNLNSTYNGEATITLLDAKRTITLSDEIEWKEDYGCYLYRGSARECTYDIENDVLYKGKASVTDGQFSIEFVLPKDISFSDKNGRIVLFAHSNERSAGGSFTNVIFNGLNTLAVNDGTGPNLDVYLNNENFFNGDLSGKSAKLIVEIADSSGINTTGTGVGHEITATIDTQPMQTFVLNDYFEGTLNDFSSGRIEYPLENLPQGSYSLKVRAWDVNNNPSEKSIFFDVADSDELVVDKVYNYPNPMNNQTVFTFEHNQQGNPLDVDIRIYTLSGKPVQHLNETITNTSSSYASIPWNGRDRDHDRLGNGTYIYVLRVTATTPEGRRTTEKIEKLVIIR